MFWRFLPLQLPWCFFGVALLTADYQSGQDFSYLPVSLAA
jgi:hypothetical protein